MGSDIGSVALKDTLYILYYKRERAPHCVGQVEVPVFPGGQNLKVIKQNKEQCK